MPVTSASYVKSSVPAFYGSGKYAHRIRRVGVEYYLDRANTPKYRTTKKTSGPYATIALAQAAADADVQLTRPTGVTPTVTTAGYTQPAVGATVTVAVASVTGLVVGMSVTIATGGTYQITNIAALVLTIRNLGAADAAAPTTAITTAKAVTAVAGPG
jgi:hypothetical protein